MAELYPIDPADEDCPECGSKGWKARGSTRTGITKETCSACHGDGTRGKVCPECVDGKVAVDPSDGGAGYERCPACNGTGRIPGNANAPTVIEVRHFDSNVPQEVGWRWRCVTYAPTWSAPRGTKEEALKAAREALTDG